MGRVYARPASPLIGLILWSFAGVSSQAQKIELEGAQLRELNNALLRIHGNMQQSRADQWEGLRAEAGPVLEQRFAALSELIQNNPGEALKFAFSPELADDLAAKFPQFASLIERHGSWQGPVERWVMDYADRKSSREVLWLKAGNETLEVHFAGKEPAGLKSGDVVEVTGVQLGRRLAVTSDANAATEPRERLDIRDNNTRRRHSPVGTTPTPTTTTGAVCSTTGVQNTAVLLVTWPGVTPPSSVTPQGIDSLFFGTTAPSLDGYWREASYGQTSAVGNVFGWYTLSGSYSCSNISQFATDAMSTAAAAGVNFNSYQRVFIVFPDMSPSCGWGGLSSIGCYSLNTSSGTYPVSTSVLVWKDMIAPDQGATLIAHEGGHQLGLAHARRREFGTEPLGPLGATGTLLEYGDSFSAMGPPNLGHYAAGHKTEQLNWLKSDTNYTVVQSSGTYTLQPYESSPAGLDALKIQRGTGNNAWLWVEYRQPIGAYDSTLPIQPFSGALIHYEDPITAPQTDLLDFTAPNTYAYNPALVAGQTWADPYTNLSLSILSATTTGLTVSVNYGAVPCTPSNPTVTASPSDPSIFAGNNIGYNVSITNNDSAGCSASTFNLGSSQPSGWPTSYSATAVSLSPGQSASVSMTKTGPAGTPPGTYAVDANAVNSANGTYVGSGTANVTVMSAPSMTITLSVPSTSYTRKGTVSLAAMVLNAGTPVVGASVTFTMTRPNGSTATQSATTSRKGTATWTYKLGSNSLIGTYSVVSRATVTSGATANSNAVSFSVQ